MSLECGGVGNTEDSAEIHIYVNILPHSPQASHITFSPEFQCRTLTLDLPFDVCYSACHRPNWVLSLLSLPRWSYLQTLTFLFLKRSMINHSRHPHGHILYILHRRFQALNSSSSLLLWILLSFPNYGSWLSHISTIGIMHTINAGISRDLRTQNHLQRKLGCKDCEDNRAGNNSFVAGEDNVDDFYLIYSFPLWAWLTFQSGI